MLYIIGGGFGQTVQLLEKHGQIGTTNLAFVMITICLIFFKIYKHGLLYGLWTVYVYYTQTTPISNQEGIPNLPPEDMICH
jgi:hypothetical protein